MRRLYLYTPRTGKRSLPGEPIRFVASTETPGRDGLIIRADAWLLDNYHQNPIVLWAHRYTDPPIGRAQVFTEGRNLVADVLFDRGDPFAREVERKYREGFLYAVSVGWDTLEQVGRVVTRAELLDVSAVPVPGDPAALIQRIRTTTGVKAYRPPTTEADVLRWGDQVRETLAALQTLTWLGVLESRLRR
jgi:hypothetical protein